MKFVFPAIETRFDANSTLTGVGRKLYRVTDDTPNDNTVRPFTVVAGTLVETLDTFASDIEIWSLVFGFIGKRVDATNADTWLEQMIASFEDADITSADFSTAGCKLISQEAPVINDVAYDAGATFELTIERTVLNPVARGS